MADDDRTGRAMNRRDFLRTAGRSLLLLGTGAVLGGGLWRSAQVGHIWRIDPTKCVQCGRCATHCVLNPSAVKCVHHFADCGYCDLCFGFFHPAAPARNERVENQLCPTNAIVRRFIEDPYYEYSIVTEACIGCGKCVKGCRLFGNGSLRLAIDAALCVNCNECAIARVCAGDAFERVAVAGPSV